MTRGKAIVTAAYVVPLLAVTVGLILIGDVVIAVALVVVEVTVAGSIAVVGRSGRPTGDRPPPRVRGPGEPVLGLPGEDAASGRAVALAAIGLVGLLLVLGLVIAVLSSHS